jgi:hypothetical protein
LRKFESQALKPPFNGRPGAAGPGLGEAARRGGSQTSVSQAAGSAGGLPVPVACAAQTPRTQALPACQEAVTRITSKTKVEINLDHLVTVM